MVLTSWSGSGVLTYECAVNPDVTAAFASTQGQLNVLLFVPFGLFAVLATRRVLPAVASGVVFTAVVETAQATVPFISRLCDTDDLVANVAGALAGAAVGALIDRRVGKGKALSRGFVRRAGFVGASVAALVVAAWVTLIEPTKVFQPSEIPAATAEQARALDDALGKAFRAAPEVKGALYFDHGDGTAVVSMPLAGGGYAEISWPDREQFTAHFTPSSHGEGVHAYEIPGVSRRVGTAQDAKKVAEEYAASYAPWALPGSKVSVRAIDETVGIGWMVEWRRRSGDVLMPMRLNIAIEPSGRMIDLIARHIEDPRLPESRIGEREAWERFETAHGLAAGEGERTEPVLLAERRDGRWRVHWRLSARDGGTLLSAVVDATDGSVHSPSADEVPDTGQVVQP
ncbi:VanZ family protein [Streptomyces sp. NPDC004539]|uniref:VanZ family protein n=1 Tax=Streptomyces sp. NPDC004539 TaxID=3154280 RepID=UPI0033B84DD1